MTKAIVTGANGFLGANLCRKLLLENYEVTVLVRKNSDLSDLEGLNLKKCYGDITDLKSLNEAFKNQDVVFHLAGLISYKKYDREKMNQVNIEGTKNVISACKNTHIKKLLFLSSVVTVGASFNPEVLNEKSVYKIKDLNLGYFETKRLAEKEVIAASKDLFTVIVNPSAIYGFADAKKGSRKNQVKVAQGKLPFYTSGGLNVISVDDVIDGLLLALKNGKSGERYILSNENITIKKLFELIAKKASVPAPYFKMPTFILHTLGFWGDLLKKGLSQENAYTATMFHWFDSSKAKTELGFQPQKTAEQAIEDSVNWMKQNGYLK